MSMLQNRYPITRLNSHEKTWSYLGFEPPLTLCSLLRIQSLMHKLRYPTTGWVPQIRSHWCPRVEAKILMGRQQAGVGCFWVNPLTRWGVGWSKNRPQHELLEPGCTEESRIDSKTRLTTLNTETLRCYGHLVIISDWEYYDSVQSRANLISLKIIRRWVLDFMIRSGKTRTVSEIDPHSLSWERTILLNLIYRVALWTFWTPSYIYTKSSIWCYNC